MDMSQPGMVDVSEVVAWLLQHEPESRPSAKQLLSSRFMPTTLEDRVFDEALRVVVNPSTTHYSGLMDALFSHAAPARPPAINIMFYPPARNATDDWRYESLIKTKIRNRLVAVFTRHGALELETPLFMPVTDLLNEDQRIQCQLLDRTGQQVALPFDLTVNFARYAARHNVGRIRRYCISRVFRPPPSGVGHPREHTVCRFDIVGQAEDDNLVDMSVEADVELLRVVHEVIDDIRLLVNGDVTIRINNTRIINAVLEEASVPGPARSATVVALGTKWRVGWSAVKKQLADEIGLAPKVVSALSTFFDAPRWTSEGVMARSERFLRDNERGLQAVRHLETIVRRLADLGVDRLITTDHSLVHNQSHHEGLVFQVSLSTSDNPFELLAAGGRYDPLLRLYPQDPASGERRHRAAGVSFAFDRIVGRVFTLAKRQGRQTIGVGSDVLVASVHGDTPHVRMHVAAKLWDAGFSAEYEHDINASTDRLLQRCRAVGTRWLVLVKSNSLERDVVRCRSVFGAKEYDVMLSDLCAFLRRMSSSLAAPAGRDRRMQGAFAQSEVRSDAKPPRKTPVDAREKSRDMKEKSRRKRK